MEAGISERQRLHRVRPALEKRSRMNRAARAFFLERGFLEVETPVRVAAPALEDYIDAEPAGTMFLRTSPELHMKRLLAAGYDKIYQIGPCFRHGEEGRRHRPEFTMLEWYRLGADYRDILRDTVQLVQDVAIATNGTTVVHVADSIVDLAPPWEEMTLEAAFAKYADEDLDRVVARGQFDEVLVARVEPNLGKNRPTVLIDYPAACGGLSKTKPDNLNRVERWELYVAGLELANACTELTDPDEQRKRFEACARLRHDQGRTVYAIDEGFMAALDTDMPHAAGIAVGMDRLTMVLSGADDIRDVVAFPEEQPRA